MSEKYKMDILLLWICGFIRKSEIVTVLVDVLLCTQDYKHFYGKEKGNDENFSIFEIIRILLIIIEKYKH